MGLLFVVGVIILVVLFGVFFIKDDKQEKTLFEKHFSIGECSGGSFDDRVDIAFNHLDDSKLPNIKIEVYRNGKARILMNGSPIPSLIGEYKNACFAKKAILEYLKKTYADEVVETINVGANAEEPQPPKAE